MTHATVHHPAEQGLGNQEIALHMIASAARILLMIGTAVLVGEVAVGPARRLIAAHRNGHAPDAAPIGSTDTQP